MDEGVQRNTEWNAYEGHEVGTLGFFQASTHNILGLLLNIHVYQPASALQIHYS